MILFFYYCFEHRGEQLKMKDCSTNIRCTSGCKLLERIKMFYATHM